MKNFYLIIILLVFVFLSRADVLIAVTDSQSMASKEGISALDGGGTIAGKLNEIASKLSSIKKQVDAIKSNPTESNNSDSSYISKISQIAGAKSETASKGSQAYSDLLNCKSLSTPQIAPSQSFTSFIETLVKHVQRLKECVGVVTSGNGGGSGSGSSSNNNSTGGASTTGKNNNDSTEQEYYFDESEVVFPTDFVKSQGGANELGVVASLATTPAKIGKSTAVTEGGLFNASNGDMVFGGDTYFNVIKGTSVDKNGEGGVNYVVASIDAKSDKVQIYKPLLPENLAKKGDKILGIGAVKDSSSGNFYALVHHYDCSKSGSSMCNKYTYQDDVALFVPSKNTSYLKFFERPKDDIADWSYSFNSLTIHNGKIYAGTYYATIPRIVEYSLDGKVSRVFYLAEKGTKYTPPDLSTHPHYLGRTGFISNLVGSGDKLYFSGEMQLGYVDLSSGKVIDFLTKASNSVKDLEKSGTGDFFVIKGSNEESISNGYSFYVAVVKGKEYFANWRGTKIFEYNESSNKFELVIDLLKATEGKQKNIISINYLVPGDGNNLLMNTSRPIIVDLDDLSVKYLVNSNIDGPVTYSPARNLFYASYCPFGCQIKIIKR